ncbi:hypothetical protein LCGC14_2746410, partial [marine sediment metagenome]
RGAAGPEDEEQEEFEDSTEEDKGVWD